ncbi:hypothetical protein Csa_009198 [Cucumis sativus]|uniref:Uncharacterized protein n=1 Tax=Cucumis sativus TaxID=3659 RepID=A0A0A0KXP0_CUCSA|nr:hypothetical protein Csa_009198 [Cucumis sativus]
MCELNEDWLQQVAPTFCKTAPTIIHRRIFLGLPSGLQRFHFRLSGLGHRRKYHRLSERYELCFSVSAHLLMWGCHILSITAFGLF